MSLQNRHKCVWRLLVAVAFSSVWYARADLVLVEGGQAKATIVVAENPSPQASESAQVLQELLARISGAHLAIRSEGERISGPRILVGRSRAVSEAGVELPSGHTPAMDEEGFVVQTIGTDLVLAGNEDWRYRGTAFAVYDFLEKDLGCRWFFPGPYGEVLPRLATITVVKLDRREHPSFRIRNIWYAGWMPVDKTDQEWMRRWSDLNKLNSLSLSLPGDGSISRLAPAEQYFNAHPEIFALDKNGKRVKDMLCMSEPETVRIAAATIKDAFKKDPDCLSFGFAPPDGYPICFCPRCQSHFPGFTGKGYGDPSLSDVWFRFANSVASEVYKEFPDRWILTNGYANRARPPESIGALSPNLGVQSAIISACSIHRIGDPKCWQRQAYEDILGRWMNQVKCVFVYDYDPAKAVDNLPFPTLHCLKHDMPFFKKGGLWGFWTEASNSWMVTHLNYYVRAKLMWNADANVDDLVHDYCVRFYGDASAPIERYIWTLEKAVENTTTHETWGRIMQWPSILPPVKNKLDTLMTTAEKHARDPETAQRVHVLRLTHDHMMTYLAMENASSSGDFAKAVELSEHMVELRSEANRVQSGLLSLSTDLAKTHTSSVEGLRKVYQTLAEKCAGPSGQLITMLPRQWRFKTDPKDIGVVEQWYLPDHARGWRPIDITREWENQGFQDKTGWGYWGKAWYAADFDVPSSAAGRSLRLAVGGVYNQGVWVWVNGVMREFNMTRHWRLGFQEDHAPFDVDVTDLVRPGQTNHVAILVSTDPPNRDPRGGLHRRVFLWSPQ